MLTRATVQRNSMPKMKAMSEFYYQRKAVFECNLLSGFKRKRVFSFFQIPVITVMLFLLMSAAATAQLGVYAFTGGGTCPTQNPAVTSQPANAVFTNFSTVNANCKSSSNECEYEHWNKNGTIDLNEYHQFTITANANYTLNLT